MVQSQNVFSLCSHPQKNCELDKGPFKNYVDKMRGRRGSKNVCVCPRRGRGKKRQNSVHVVVEWPPKAMELQGRVS